ncbi:MAG TPA: RHS repeat-associated core domain-containing protein [Candidatus Rifleibacterium sp.]|nr:RHS repeat-associated core domain-containing protein [Candidatus Rifleibacterium sp.]
MSSAEKTAISDFVTSGKGLFFTGDYIHLDFPKYNDVSQIFGFTFNCQYIDYIPIGNSVGAYPEPYWLNYYTYAPVYEFQSYYPPAPAHLILNREPYNGYSWFYNESHEIFNGIDSVLLMGAGYLTPKTFGVAALKTHPLTSRPSDYGARIGFPLVVVREHGNGRVMISADSNAFTNNGFLQAAAANIQNSAFALNIFNWLAKGSAHQTEVSVTPYPSLLMIDSSGTGTGITFRASSSDAGTIAFTLASGTEEWALGDVTTSEEGLGHVAKLSWWGQLPTSDPDEYLIASPGTYLVKAEINGSVATASITVTHVEASVVGVGAWMKDSKDPAAVIPTNIQPEYCPVVSWEQMAFFPIGYFSALSVSDPVNIVSGNYLHSCVDISLQARLSIVLARIYNSLDSNIGIFGRGWSSPFTSHLEIQGSNIIFVNSDGSRIRFIKTGTIFEADKNVELGLSYSNDTGIYTLSHPHGSQWSFDSDGRIINMVKSCCGSGISDSIRFAYDDSDKLTKVSGANGQYLDFFYNIEGRVISVTDSTGRGIAYEYDSQQNLVAFSDTMGRRTDYLWDDDGLMSKVTLPGNKATQIFYTNNRVIKIIEPDNSTSEFAWATDTYQLTLTDPLANTHIYRFSPAWRLIGYELNGTNSTISSRGFVSDGLALTGMTDSMGYTTSYTYDSDGLIQSSTDKLGNISTIEWHQTLHKLTRKTDALGRSWSYEWCARGNLIRETDPAGNITRCTYDSHNNRTSKTDPLGRVTRYVYDSTGNYLIQTIDAMGGISSFTYDLRGNMLTSTDALGRTTVYQYDLLDRLVKTTYPDGRYTQVIYDEAGNIASRKDNLNRTTAYTYDAAGRMLSTTRPDGSVLSHAYDASGRKISSTDALGRITGYEYDALDNLVKVTYPDQSCQTYVYDTEKRLISSSDELGNVIAYEYDPMGRMLATIDPAGARYESTYDVAGRKVAARDPLGRTTTWTYDVLDRVTKTAAPDQTFSLNSYDAVGNLLISTNALNQQTVYEYDALNRQIKTTRPGGAQFVTAYDAAGQVVSETDALGNTTSYSYDAGGRRVATTRADGKQFISVYDTVGRLVKTIDPLNASSTVSYDIMDRASSETDALGRTTRYEYDAGGKRIAKIDPIGRRRLYGYDTRDRLTTEVDAEGRMVSHAYDAAGRKTGLTDGAGRIWRWVYDAVGRVIAEIDPLGHQVKSSYDLAGNPVLKTNARNQATGYEYDLMNRLVKVNYPDATIATFSYDALGRELVRSGAAGAVEKSYDLAGNLVSEKFINHNKAWNYSFDMMGNRIQAISPENETFRYVYDRLYRLTVLETGKASEKVAYAYDALGRNIETVRADSTTANKFDAAGQLLEMKHYRLVLDKDCGKHKKGKKNEPAYKEEILALRQYAYDLSGNRVSMTDEDGKITVYAYDASNWLKQVDYPGNQRVSYTYNDAGDRLSEQTGSNPAVQYAYDAAGRMIGRGSESFSYDADGNMLTDAVATYTWNSDNRLVRVEKTLDACKHDKYRHGFGYGHLKHGKETTLYEEYSYLPEDWRRVSRKSGKYEQNFKNRGFCRDNEEETFVSVYDGDDESQEYQLSTSKAGRRNKKETLRLNLLREFIGGPVADDLEHTRYNRLSLSMLKDGLSSTIAITGREAKVLADIDYDAWGNFCNQGKDSDLPCRHGDFDDYLDRFENTRGFGSAAHNKKAFGKYFADRLTPYLYTGRRYSNFTSQYFNRNRYYSPALGRFTSKDPIGFNGGMNLYRYADNNPVLFTDPWGNISVSVTTATSLYKSGSFTWSKSHKFEISDLPSMNPNEICPKYCVVQWFKGTARFADNTFFEVKKLYDQDNQPIDKDFWRVDSKDTNPIYGNTYGKVIFPGYQLGNNWYDTVSINLFPFALSKYPLDYNLKWATAIYELSDIEGKSIADLNSNPVQYLARIDPLIVKVNWHLHLKFTSATTAPSVLSEYP